MSKLDEIRALRERRAGVKQGRKPPKSARPALLAGKAGTRKAKAPSKARVASNKPRVEGVAAKDRASPPAPHDTVKIGGTPAVTTVPGFDRVLYQRVYTKLWHKNGRQGQSHWPAEDRATLAQVKSRPS